MKFQDIFKHIIRKFLEYDVLVRLNKNPRMDYIRIVSRPPQQQQQQNRRRRSSPM